MAKLIVGLGNMGSQYSGTRHNAGFWCVERLAQEHSIRFSKRRRHTLVGEGTVGDIAVALVKPRTYVNRSGQAVTSLLAVYGAAPQDLLVIYDDLDLEPGRLRLRAGGGAGGHGGMKSIIQALGNQDIARIRIGIGRPPPGVNEVEYVLGTMDGGERQKVQDAVGRAAEAVACILTEGFDTAMNRFN